VLHRQQQQQQERELQHWQQLVLLSRPWTSQRSLHLQRARRSSQQEASIPRACQQQQVELLLSVAATAAARSGGLQDRMTWGHLSPQKHLLLHMLLVVLLVLLVLGSLMGWHLQERVPRLARWKLAVPSGQRMFSASRRTTLR
jgi:hypothetical protein